MKNFLAINIDPNDLGTITDLLTEHTPDYKIFTSQKIREIDGILKTIPTDLVIINLVNPSPQDLKTLDNLSKSYPRLPLLVMTGFETGEIKSAIKAIGAIRYFQKPVDFKELVDAILKKIERSVGGEISGISLTSFLQMSEMEKTSCTLSVKAGKKSGTLYLFKGALIAAEAGDLKNEKAVFDILSWENPSIEIDEAPVEREKEIETPLISILMESAKRKDARRKKKTAPKKAAAAPPKGEKGAVPAAKKAKKKLPVTDKAPEPEIDYAKLEELKASGKVADASKIVKRKHLITLISRLAAAAVILLIILGLWQYVVNPWLKQREFHNVIAKANSATSIQEKLLILDEYLASDPKTEYADKAKKNRYAYANQVEAQAFERAIRAVDGLPLDDNFQEAAKATYLKFIEQFPDSPHQDEINQRIVDLPNIMAGNDYAELKDIPENHYTQRLKAYQAYLTKYPDGADVDSVRDMKNSLGEALYQYIETEKTACDQDNNWQRCINLCQYFQDNFQQHPRVDDITALQRDMTGQDAYAKIAEEIEKTGPFTGKAEKILEDHLRDHPNSPAREAVEAQLATINRNKNQEKVWQQLIDYVRNSQNNIFERIDRMERYLNQQPPNSHQNDAELIYAWLLKEKEKTLRQRDTQVAAEKLRQQNKARLEQEKKRIVSRIKQSGGRFSVNRADTITDNQTGLTWCMLDSSILLSNPCLDYQSAVKYVRDLNTGGYNDWRLPDTGEMLIVYNSNAGFPVNHARWYWTSETFHTAWKKKVSTVFRTDSDVWKKTEADMEKCGAVRAVRP